MVTSTPTPSSHRATSWPARSQQRSTRGDRLPRPAPPRRRRDALARSRTWSPAWPRPGLDLAARPDPGPPAAHYLMGGIVTDLDGATTLAGLYAVRRVRLRRGVHGANRLASNSLLECFVFAHRAVDAGLAGAGRTGGRRRRRTAPRARAAGRAAAAHVGRAGPGATPRADRAERVAGRQPDGNPVLVAELIAACGAAPRREPRRAPAARDFPGRDPDLARSMRCPPLHGRRCDRPRPGRGRRRRRRDDRGDRAGGRARRRRCRRPRARRGLRPRRALAVFRRLDPEAAMEVHVGRRRRGRRPRRPPSPGFAGLGTARVLTGERTALNLLQRLSGIATATREYVEAVPGTGAEILDTRKTAPGLRALDKRRRRLRRRPQPPRRARRRGADQGQPRRDRRRRRRRRRARSRAARPDLPVEVEVDTLDQLDEALAAGAETRPAGQHDARAAARGGRAAPPAGPAWRRRAASPWRPCERSPRRASTRSRSAP